MSLRRALPLAWTEDMAFRAAFSELYVDFPGKLVKMQSLTLWFSKSGVRWGFCIAYTFLHDIGAADSKGHILSNN